VDITIGTHTYKFESAKNDNGMDCGVGFPESDISLSSPTIRYCTNKVVQHVGNERVEKDQTILVCKVKTGSPAIECYTILNGLENASAPILGRFVLHDCAVRHYTGAFAQPENVCIPSIKHSHFNLNN
jgi:hypothetical protein